MSQKSERAAIAVTELFTATPTATMDDLYAVAVNADRRLKKVGRRSFNATYVLPLKRAVAKKSGKMAAPKRRGRKSQAAVAKNGAVGNKSVAAKKGALRRGVRLSDLARTEARRLVLERDRLVLTALGSGGDPHGAYELAANIDQYVERLAATLRK